MKQKLFLTILLSSLLFSSCDTITGKKEDNNNASLIAAAAVISNQKTTSSSQTIIFRAVAGTEATDLNCTSTFKGHASIQEANLDPLFHISESVNFQLIDLRFYIYDIKLVKADGTTSDFTLTPDGVWQSSRVALLDFETGTGTCTGGTTATNTSIRGSYPAGSYTGIKFSVGVPFDLNHLNSTTQSAPLNNSAMFWSWQSGYKFLKFEFKINESTATTNYVHIGSNGCPASNATGPNAACASPNRATFTVSKASGTINFATESVAIDVKALLNGTNANATAGGAVISCMPGNGTTACNTILTNIGITSGTGESSGTQTTFSIK
jgi:uncharacterized repeat protein (TIGR04052 family)